MGAKLVVSTLFLVAGLVATSTADGQAVAIPTIKFALPIACEIGRTCEIQNYVDRDPGPASKDFLCGTASYNDHSGVDFRLLNMSAQRLGVNVLAAAPGRVSRVRDGVADVSVKTIDRATIQGRECGNGVVIDHGNGVTTQYCHMANGSIVVQPGAAVSTGDPLGRVGLSGNTEYPHLHFTVKRGDTLIDPFAPLSGTNGRCGSGQGMWDTRTEQILRYKASVILNTGFSDAPVSMEQVESGVLSAPNRNAPLLIAYTRAINLQTGDVQRLRLIAPDGSILATTDAAPLSAPQAQRLLYVGKRKPIAGWPSGAYKAEYSVIRAQRIQLSREFTLRL
jgi:hypothetical protein